MKIYWSGDTAEVLCADNSRFEADCVLFTVSLGVLKNLCNELFEPELPEFKLKAIKVSKIFFYERIKFTVFIFLHYLLKHIYFNHY